MANQFLGEIRAVGFNFAPTGWAFCNGQLLPISQNTALFSLLGTYYGGNGTSTFALPDLRSSVALDSGNGPGLSIYSLGQSGGQSMVTLTAQEMPMHRHELLVVNSPATSTNPTAGFFGVPSVNGVKQNLYGSAPGSQIASPEVIRPTGGSGSHDNRQPFLTMNYIIALTGVFPARS